MRQPAPDPFTLAIVQRVLETAVRPLADRVAALEARLDKHEKRLNRPHSGKYVPGRLYEINEECTRNGSTWRAVVDDPKTGPPGDGWVLVAQGTRRNPE